MSADAAWKKIDEHTKAIQELEVQQQLNSKVLESHAEEFRSMNRNTSRQHGEIMAKIDAVAADVGTVMADYHVRRGSGAITKWLLPLLISIIGLLFAYIMIVRS